MPTKQQSARQSARSVVSFEPQRTGSAGLPKPDVLIKKLALNAVEIIEGARPIDQIGALITPDVASSLDVRLSLNRMRRAVAQDTRQFPHVARLSVLKSPADGVFEATVMVHSRVKSRAVALRLESIDNRWRATNISVL